MSRAQHLLCPATGSIGQCRQGDAVRAVLAAAGREGARSPSEPHFGQFIFGEACPGAQMLSSLQSTAAAPHHCTRISLNKMYFKNR